MNPDDHDSVIYPVILCGGSGTRLWPLSRKAFPKQFIPLLGDKSLLQLTLERVAPLTESGDASICCVSAEEHRFLVADVAAQAGLAVRQILEPEPKTQLQPWRWRHCPHRLMLSCCFVLPITTSPMSRLSRRWSGGLCQRPRLVGL